MKGGLQPPPPVSYAYGPTSPTYGINELFVFVVLYTCLLAHTGNKINYIAYILCTSRMMELQKRYHMMTKIWKLLTDN